MQRSALLRSSGPAAGRPPAAVGGGVLANLACPSGVIAGIFPSGGSTMSDVRLLDRPFDHHRGTAGRRRARVSIGVGQQGEKEIVSAGKVAVGVDVEEPLGSPFELGDFFVRQKLPPGEFLRPFQRRGALVQPHALQIRLAVRRQRRRPRPSPDPRRTVGNSETVSDTSAGEKLF